MSAQPSQPSLVSVLWDTSWLCYLNVESCTRGGSSSLKRHPARRSVQASGFDIELTSATCRPPAGEHGRACLDSELNS
ncbi:hypothetical protein EVAR_18810_1 [Eumeta japonica]|uniref:Uncharacterized protein n=1 Tax=Eumeta variegata TaxID=151549 RepID=A0A4C1UML5_EUMVA|nr:hypothetical protein EVAR_18810_1 [Eumeta japonica]